MRETNWSFDFRRGTGGTFEFEEVVGKEFAIGVELAAENRNVL